MKFNEIDVIKAYSCTKNITKKNCEKVVITLAITLRSSVTAGIAYLGLL
jgi:hypothetical protein